MLTEVISDERMRAAAVVAVVAIALIAILYLPPVYDNIGPLSKWVYYACLLSSVGAIVGLGVWLWRSFEAGEVLKAIYGMLALGMALWLIAEVIWATYDLVLGVEAPFPGLPDLFWALGFPPLIAALYLRLRTLGAAPSRGQLLIAVALAAIFAIAGVLLVVLPIAMAGGEATWLERAIDILFPLADLVVGVEALLVMFTLSGGRLAWPWGIIASGFLLMTVGDLLFSYATWYEIYLPEGHINLISYLADAPYAASYVIIAFGVYLQAHLLRAA